MVRTVSGFLLACALLASGCATLVTGIHQDITVNTDPSGAECRLERQGAPIGSIGATPGTVRVERSMYDISIICNKVGYAQTTYLNRSGSEAWVAGNGVTGAVVKGISNMPNGLGSAGIGLETDSAMGADNKYQSNVSFALARIGSSADVQTIDGKNGKSRAQQIEKQIESNVGDRAQRVANNVRDAGKRTANKLEDWWVTPLPEPKPTAVPASYCYNVLQDVLCYRQPMPGWEHRLAGYQGTGAEPPPPATTKPLPVAKIDPEQMAVSRIRNSKPVFVQMPPDMKPPEPEPGEATDSMHETLPDPTLSPQL